MTARYGPVGNTDPLLWDACGWLPTDDPATRHHVDAILRQIGALGLEPIGALRAAITRWFGSAAAIALPAPKLCESPPEQSKPHSPLAHMWLSAYRRRTLWPQRPKRQPDELFSSWLRRAAIAAGIAPRCFAREIFGHQCGDIDRFVSELALQRLAIVSGQRPEFLAAGTLTATADPADPEIIVQNAALKVVGLDLRRLQFCALCLTEKACPSFQRKWRFAYEVVCLKHECWLHPGCSMCGAPVVLQRQRDIEKQPACWKCSHFLSETPTSLALAAAKQQRALTHWLCATAHRGDPENVQKSVRWLATKLFRNGRSVAVRQRVFETDLFTSLADIPDRQPYSKSRRNVAGKRILAASSPVRSNRPIELAL